METSKIKIGVGVLAIIAAVLLSGCIGEKTNETLVCESDEDCICVKDGCRDVLYATCLPQPHCVHKKSISELRMVCDESTECKCVNGSCRVSYKQEIVNQTQTTKEKSCINSGGTVSTSMCCESAGDFPNTCLIGACGCAPDYSHEVKTCDCGQDGCFDGNVCVPSEMAGLGEVAPQLTASIATDQSVYHSRQTANINVSVDSPTGAQDVEVRLHGINARGSERLNTAQTVNLSRGENTVQFTYTMPSCTGCAGISPGDYGILAEVEIGGEVIAKANATVNIQQ